MRKLTKGPVPQQIVTNGSALTASYLKAVADGEPKPKVWRHKEIRAALEVETIGRCAYCEANMTAVSYARIEHFRPRKIFPALVVDWNNLTLSCEKCNGHKLDKWVPASPFVNPYDDPARHFVFYGPLVKGVTDEGIYSVTHLGLNEDGRPEKRQLILDSLVLNLARYRSAPTDELRTGHLDQMKMIMEAEYTEVARAFLLGNGIPI